MNARVFSTRIHMQVHTCIDTHVCVYSYTLVCTLIHIHGHVHILYACTRIHAHTNTYTHGHTWTLRAHIVSHICAHACTHGQGHAHTVRHIHARLHLPLVPPPPERLLSLRDCAHPPFSSVGGTCLGRMRGCDRSIAFVQDLVWGPHG